LCRNFSLKSQSSNPESELFLLVTSKLLCEAEVQCVQTKPLRAALWTHGESVPLLRTSDTLDDNFQRILQLRMKSHWIQNMLMKNTMT